MVEQGGDVAALDADKIAVGPTRVDVHFEAAPDLALAAQFLGGDVTLQPVFGNVPERIRLDRWRLDCWQTGLDALDRRPRLLARFIDLQHVGVADLVPDLFAVRITGDHPKGLGAGRLHPDECPTNCGSGNG